MSHYNRQSNNRYNNRDNNNYQRNRNGPRKGPVNFCDIPKCAVYATNFYQFSDSEARSIFYPEVPNRRNFGKPHTKPEMYREEMYQAIRKLQFPRHAYADCEMYLRKFDLPNNGKSCFIHFGKNVTEHNTEQGEKIVNALFKMAKKVSKFDDETGRNVTCFIIELRTESFGVQKIEIKEYSPNQRRGNSNYSSINHSVNQTPFTRSRNESRSERFSTDDDEVSKNLQIVRNRNIGDGNVARVTNFVIDQQLRTLSCDVPRNQSNSWGKLDSGFQNTGSTTSKAESISQKGPKSPTVDPIMVESTEMDVYDPEIKGNKMAWGANNNSECFNRQSSVATVIDAENDTPKSIKIDEDIAESPSSSQKLEISSPEPPAEIEELSPFVNEQPGPNHMVQNQNIDQITLNKVISAYAQQKIMFYLRQYDELNQYAYLDVFRVAIMGQIFTSTAPCIELMLSQMKSEEEIEQAVCERVTYYTMNPVIALQEYEMGMIAKSNSSIPVCSF